MINRTSLSYRLVLCVGGSLLALALSLILYAGYVARQTALQEARERMLAIARGQAETYGKELERGLDVARTLAQTMGVARHGARLTREQANAILSQTLAAWPEFLATYTLWEENAFDGLDARYAGKPGHDATGRFIPYWNRATNGAIGLSPILDYATPGIGDFYQKPRRTGRECVIDPYYYPIHGVNVLMTSMIVPILDGQTFCGIAGVDFDIDFLQQLADRLDVYHREGRVILVSPKDIVAGATAAPAWLGRRFSHLAPEQAKLIELASPRGESCFTANGCLHAIIPIYPGRITEPWHVLLRVPKSEVFGQANAEIACMAAISLLLTVLGILLIAFLLRSLVLQKVSRLSTATQSFAEGNLATRCEIPGEDELSSLARHFNTMARQVELSTSKLRLFRELTDASTDAILVLDPPSGSILDANAAATAMTGYPREELFTLTIRDINVDLPDLPRWTHYVEDLLASGRKTWEATYRRKNGSRFPVEISSRLAAHGQRQYFIAVVRDISERRKAEAALRENEARFRAIFENSLDAINVTKAGVEVLANPAFLRLYGYARLEQVVGKPLLDHVAPAERERIRLIISQRAAGTPTATQIETRGLRTDGTEFDQEVHVATCQLGDEEHFVSIIRDITERKQAEQKLRESEERFAKTFLLAPVSTAITTLPEGRFVDVNHAFLALTGFARDQVIGQTPESLGAVLKAQPEGSLRETLQRRGIAQNVPVSLTKPNGQLRHCLFSGAVFSLAGAPHLISLVVDITDQKRAEAEVQHLKNYLSNIINSMPAMLAGIDADGRVTQWNKEAEAFTGLPAAEAQGRPVQALLPDFEPWISALHKEMTGRHPALRERLALVRDGRREYYDLMMYPLIANGIEGSVLRIENTSERVQIQDLMIQTEKMLSVGGLAAGMAHEINNPLGIISQAAQNIERRTSPDLPANQRVAAELGLSLPGLRTYLERRDIPQFMRDIREATARASRIVTNMLQFSRKSDAARQPVSLSEVLDRTLELAANDYDLKKRYDFRSIEILRDYQPGMPPVPVILVEIEQVLLNLIKNAAQALEATAAARPPRITLRLKPEPGYAIIEVEDNGPGMDDAVRSRIFEPFFTTKPPGVGTGLGLSVSYSIITQNHKGLLFAHSQPGAGTRFVVKLPLG
jgi:PAS domain S-box-containing protein